MNQTFRCRFCFCMAALLRVGVEPTDTRVRAPPEGWSGPLGRLAYLSEKAEAVGLEPTSGLRRHPFSRRGPHPAGWLPAIVIQFRGLESNQRPPRSERGVTTSSNYPGVVDSGTRIREEGFEPPPPDSKSGGLPISRFPRAPRGSRTRLSDLGSPCLAARPETLC